MTKIKKNKFKGDGWTIAFFLLLFLFLGVSFVLAQKPLEVTYPGIPGAPTPVTTKTTLPDYVQYIFQFSLFLGAFIAFGSFIYGGVRYLASAGSPSAQKDAKSQISGGVLGLTILLCAYLILNTINPQLAVFKVPLPGKAPTSRPPIVLLKPEVAELVEIPLGGLVENLWGTEDEPKKADCYDYYLEGDDATGDVVLGSLATRDRLDCIKRFSKAIQIKAKNLNEPVEELQKLYDCQNCCRDCCKNACDWTECSENCTNRDENGNWKNCSPPANLYCEGTKNEGWWENCQTSYECCQEKGMVKQYSYQKCPYSCCEFFEECPCSDTCGSDASWGASWCERCNCICIKENEEGEPVCCNPESPEQHYEDLLVRALIDKELIESGETDPYPDIASIKPALSELRLKLSPFLLTEELKKAENLDVLLADKDAQDLIKKILLGEPVDEGKLKKILRIKSVMKYLIEDGYYRNLLLADRNLAKTLMINLGLLENEVIINEVAWTGTRADASHQWIELYNNTEGNIELSEWKLVVKDKFEIELSGTIPSQRFYLLENNEDAVSDITADKTYSENLADNGEILELNDQFGNLVDRVYCPNRWFAGDGDSKASMERINPQEDGSDIDNWATNLSIKVEEEKKKDFISGKDSGGNPIYGTPKSPNSVGLNIIPYPSFDSLKGVVRDRLSERGQREKLILVLRQEKNLERMLRSEDTKEALVSILTGEDRHFKKLLSQGDIIRILLENKENSELLFANEYIKEVVKNILIDREWKSEDEENTEWEKFIENLPEARTSLKLINDFQEDLLWVLEARDLMWRCDIDPTSYDQLRVPELFGPKKVEEVPEWAKIKKEIPQIEDLDPSIFYCNKLLW